MSISLRSIAAAGVVVLVGFVAGAQAANRVAIVDEAKLEKYWKPASGVARVVPGFPGDGDHGKDVCVTIGYQISIKGETSNYAQLSVWSSRAADSADGSDATPYVQSAAAAVSLWRFSPEGRARSVYTAASFAFPGGSADPAAVRAHCQITDLEAYVAKLQDEEQRRGNIYKSRVERNRLDHANDGVWQPPGGS